MIGTIAFRWCENCPEVRATLGDDLKWTSDHPETQRFLNTCHGPELYRSASYGWPGYAQLNDAAEALNSTVVESEPPPPIDPEALY